MRRTSTCAWRRCPRACRPCVARRRRSCATTRCTAARSCERARRQRAVELAQRARRGQVAGALDLRALELAPQQRLEAAQRVARQARRGAGRSAGSSGWGSARRPSARRMRCTSTPITPEPSWRRAKAAIAIRARSRIAPSEPSRSAAAICARSASSSSSVSSPRSVRRALLARARPRARPPARRRGRRSGRTPARTRAGPPGSWRASPRAPRGSPPARSSSISPQHREGVEQLGGADRDAFAAQLLAELQDARRQPAGGAAGLRAAARAQATSAGARELQPRRARRPRPCRCGA